MDVFQPEQTGNFYNYPAQNSSLILMNITLIPQKKFSEFSRKCVWGNHLKNGITRRSLYDHADSGAVPLDVLEQMVDQRIFDIIRAYMKSL